MRNRFVKALKREDGVTLIELLAVLALMSIILGVISTTIFFGFRSYNQVSVENRLREESDVVMSSIITELYAFAPDRVYPLANGTGFEMYHVDELGNQQESDKVAVVIASNGQLEIRRNTVLNSASPPVDPYQATRISNGSIIQNLSSITIEGQTAGGFNYYTTGLININLVMSLGSGTKQSQLQLESRFGF
ncbi:prepilin-type N-terminal cleavage/methylation domain-containing protein [Saccharibacillus sp. JS10]|uniref:prepilin-type N-terminal cleavage/methylation domain-containing protein n=1 Tax=Saccharibacillus sp. JS10 TaxID=2950552 RepID=UPI0021089978|nr:prepilin-type N-terminal cleavage/methylation domain-containing protein [Saccharibacillus sp. JS10]MCQ4088777.1 prepilin-type N-terminal cleavage/methylation domain-containing protein [Saccharibacillus sp. JS10]